MNDLTELKFADPRFNLFAIADHDPDEIVRFDDIIGRFSYLIEGQIPHIVHVRVPVIVGQVVGDNFCDIA